MERGQFFVPVSVVVDGHRHDLKSATEALLFLKAWPTERRGPVYGCALNSCEAALAGKLSSEQARQAMVSFAKITGILARSPSNYAIAKGLAADAPKHGWDAASHKR